MTAQHVDAFAKRIAAADLVLCQLEVTDDVLARTLGLARQHGVFTVLNPGPARTLPPSLLQHVDLLTPNQTEARVLPWSAARRRHPYRRPGAAAD
ncbi:MAG: hypothetical protein R2856_22895 [Caldilineaceae bacterium]